MKEAYRVHQHKRGLGLDSKIEIGAGGNAHRTCIGTDSFFVIAFRKRDIRLCFTHLERATLLLQPVAGVVVPCSYLGTRIHVRSPSNEHVLYILSLLSRVMILFCSWLNHFRVNPTGLTFRASPRKSLESLKYDNNSSMVR